MASNSIASSFVRVNVFFKSAPQPSTSGPSLSRDIGEVDIAFGSGGVKGDWGLGFGICIFFLTANP